MYYLLILQHFIFIKRLTFPSHCHSFLPSLGPTVQYQVEKGVEGKSISPLSGVDLLLHRGVSHKGSLLENSNRLKDRKTTTPDSLLHASSPVLYWERYIWSTNPVLRCCHGEDYSHIRWQYLCVWYLPKIRFSKLCAMFMTEVPSLHLEQHVWPAMLFFYISKTCILSFAVKCSWTCVPRLNLWRCAEWDCAREQADRAHVRAGICQGRKVTDWCKEVLSMNCILVDGYRTALLQLRAFTFLCRFLSALGVLSGTYFVKTYGWPFPCDTHLNRVPLCKAEQLY